MPIWNGSPPPTRWHVGSPAPRDRLGDALGSRLGDALGRRRVLLTGIAGFVGPVMYQTGLGFSPLACGVATITIPLAAIGGSITSSALLARIGRTTTHAGIATMAIGLSLSISCCARRAGA